MYSLSSLARLYPASPAPAAAAMVLEATMICVDNSEWMRNGDYPPSRFEAQAEAVTILCGNKSQLHPENTMGVLAMAGNGPRVVVTPTTDLGKILTRMHRLEIGGEANLTVALQVAQLALKHRQNKMQQQRIIAFVGSPVKCEKNTLEAIGKKLKKNNVSLDVIDFGESDDEKPEKLEALVAAVNSGDNSHIVHVPPCETSLADVILGSPLFVEDEGNGFAAAATEVYGLEFGVDPNLDPELALALRISMEEERARQEAAAKKAAQESSKAESKGQSSTSQSDVVMADAEPAPNPSTEDKRNQLTDDDAQVSQRAHAMSMEDAEMFDRAVLDAEVALALQMSLEDGKTGTQSDRNEVFEDQSFVASVLNSLPGVDPNDPSVKDLVASLHGHKEQEKEEKEDNPETDKNQ
ncbi:hypothetical protein ACP70R_020678 [Stipagrostis hirtigluma subsp. patula]